MKVKHLTLIVFIKLLQVCFVKTEDVDPTIVTLPTGKIQGHILQTSNNKDYYAFQEIPYASAPIGELRFKEPVPPENWDGILNATQNVKICYQQGPFLPTPDVTETEDCLYINVYTPVPPRDSSASLLPVLVWIHGGGYLNGDGTFQVYGPEYFIDEDIVVVAMNYRLGPFGFLTTEDGVIPGNIGLKDQNFALQWVNQNIELFGGDATKVTIDGCSAGGSSVALQVISKKSKGLFRGGILQSGTAICEFTYQTDAKYLAFTLGRALDENFNSEDSTELLELLLNSDATLINQLSENMDVPEDMSIYWVPVLEDERYEGAFITSPMEADIREGNINQVPLILGFMSEEEVTMIASDPGKLKQQGQDFDKNLTTVVGKKLHVKDNDKYTVGEKLRSIYTDGAFEDDFAALVTFMSDESFTTPIIRHADLQSHYTDIFLYQFSYKGLHGDMMVYIDGVDPGLVGHAEDIRYMWRNITKADISTYPEGDILTHRRIVKFWANFVKYLNPTPEEDDLFDNVIWEKVSPHNIAYLNFNATLEVKTNPKSYKQWEEVIDTYANPPHVVY